ncbi:MAG TPA: superoxide dismutase family protein [Luteimonas sp.]|nr:superoxide dismutase family protein [Luteimonas sp.]
MRMTHTLLAAAMLMTLSACDRSTEPAAAADAAATPAASDPAPPADTAPMAPASGSAMAASATTTLAATEGNAVAGDLRLEASNGGVRISGTVTGLAPGSEHGFHVHEKGDCSAPDASSAGGHFNPADTDHGKVGQAPHHGGDTDNLTADAQGSAQVDRMLEGVTLGDGAATDVVGKAVVVHAKPDDYTSQPSGDAGDRLACGVIAKAG